MHGIFDPDYLITQAYIQTTSMLDTWKALVIVTVVGVRVPTVRLTPAFEGV